MAVRRRRRLLGGGALFRLTPASLPPGATFTRSTTATQVDPNGVYQTAGANALRSGHYIGGVLRTNLLPWSRDLTNAAWSKRGTATVAKTATDKDGFSNAASAVTGLGVTGNDVYIVSVPAKVSTRIEPSLYLQKVSTSGTVQLQNPQNNTNGTWSINLALLGTGWERITRSHPAVTIVSEFVGSSGDVAGFLLVAASGTLAINVDYTQLEPGTVSTAPIVTGATAVSVADGGTQSILLEGSRTNSVLWSRDLTNAAWTFGGVGSRTQNAVGLDGTANSATTVADTDATSSSYVSQNVTVANDGAKHAKVWLIAKDTNQTRFPGFQIFLNGGTTTINFIVQVNTQTGAMAVEIANAACTSRVVDAGLWWAVELTVTNNATGNVTLSNYLYPARGSTLGTNAVAATGACVVGQVQVELNAPFYSSPIFTTTAAVTRGADNDQNVFSAAPQVSTFYVKFVDMGSAVAGGRIIQVGNNGGDALEFMLWATGGKYQAYHQNGTVTVLSTAASAPAYGDTVELRGVLNADGSVQLGQSINGAAEVVAAVSGPATLAPAWTNPTLCIGSRNGAGSAFAAFQSVKIATGVRSLADMRSF